MRLAQTGRVWARHSLTGHLSGLRWPDGAVKFPGCLYITAFAKRMCQFGICFEYASVPGRIQWPSGAKELSRIHSNTAALVDHKRDPAIARNGQQRRFHGISAVSQLGNPADGGFGVLPIRNHFWARHVIWALKLVVGLAAQLSEVPPWVLAARVALSVPMCSIHSSINSWLFTNNQATHAMSSIPSSKVCIAHLPPL